MSDMLAAIISNPEKVGELQPEAIPALMAQLAAIQTALAARLLTAEPSGSHQALGHYEDRLITVEEAAVRLCFTEQYVYELTRKGQLPCIKQGKYKRISLSDLSDWIDKHRETGLDNQLCQWHNKYNDTKRTATAKKKTRSHPGANGRQNRDNVKRFGAAGTGRAENLGTLIPTGQTSGAD